MRKEYRETFDEIHASGRLREEVMDMKHAENVGMRPKSRVPIAALIAAVLVVVLAGTGFAAIIDQLNLQVFPDGKDAGYSVTGGSMTRFTLSAFSDKLLEASEGRGDLAVVGGLYFDTWDELRGFLGRDIPCAWPDNGENWSDRYQVFLFHTGSDRLWGVEICSQQTSDRVLALINVYIRTENWSGDTALFEVHGDGIDGTYSQKGSYQMANGLTAEVVQYAGSEEYPHACCEGWFMQDGIMYDVQTYGTTSTLEDTLARLYAILDAYE